MLFNLAGVLSSAAFVCTLASVVPFFYVNEPAIPPNRNYKPEDLEKPNKSSSEYLTYLCLLEAHGQPACLSVKLRSKSRQPGFEAASDLFVILAAYGSVFKVHSQQKSGLTKT